MVGASNGFAVDFERREAEVEKLAAEFVANRPFPHICINGFLEQEVAEMLADEFPSGSNQDWIHYSHYNEEKLGRNNVNNFPPVTRHIVEELNSRRFLSWLEKLTGIHGLIADPSMEGGGLHQTETGGFLNLHTDFSHHSQQKQWRRRCNLILFLNDEWNKDWGGNLELWNEEVSSCQIKLAPILNRAVIFETSDRAIHGHPEPLNAPDGVTRKSLALYYYTDDGRSGAKRSTQYRPRPSDKLGDTMLIWLDNQLLRAYSWLKRNLGFSEERISRVVRRVLGRERR